MRVLKKFKWLLVIPAVLISVGLAVVLAADPKPRNTAAESDTGSTILTLSAKGSYNITQADGLDVAQMEDFALTSSPGDPMLPHKIQDILLPADVLESTVELKVVSAQTRILDGTYDIKPAGLPIRGDNKSIVNGRNTGVYQSDAGFPESPVKLLACSQMRKWKFARVDFSPFQYNPVSKKLTFTESVQIEISYQHSPAALDASLMRDTVWEDIAASRFLNYTEAKDQYEIEMPMGQPEPSPAINDYVIITTNAINTNSTKLNSFVTHKTNQGYSVQVVIYETSIQGLAGQAPNNRAEKIRQWLINNYVSMGIQYVLLIGDPSPYESGEGDIPMKMCHPESNSNYQDVNQTPTDYFYADLTGNWDIDNDQLYGEWDPDGDGVTWSGDYPVTGGVDFTPEVYVGRIPVYDDTDVTDLDSILQKMIDYETKPASSIGWRASTLLPMGFQDSSGPYDGAQLAEQMKDDYLDPAGYSNWRMYQQGTAYASDDSIYTSEEELRGNPATPNVKNRWSGAGTPAAPNDFGIVCWWGHGAATYTIVGYGTTHQDGRLMQSSYCSSLDDTHPAFVYQCSCNNGWPENSNNLQYAILEQGGIATVSATRISWFSTSIGYGGYDGSVTNSGIGYEYVDRLVQSLAAGDALYGAKSSMSPNTHECWLMNWYDFNLYGDPSLGIGLAGNLKWEQKPDLTENGIDIRCDRGDPTPRVLADDFNCTTTGPITNVVLWGSWHDDHKGNIKKIHLSIHDDDPCGPMGWSEPNNLLWSRDFGPSEFNETPYATLIDPEWWWDPATQQPPIQPGDYVVWQYDITIDSSNQFIQQGDPCNPVIYWLDVYVELEVDPQDPNIYEFGWKTRDRADGHFKDDAVWSGDDGANWNELRYPLGHNYYGQSIDLAFKILTGEPEEPSYIKWSQPPVEWEEPNVFVGWDEESHDRLPRMVADDFLCDTNRPVTAIRWWGSFLNWNQPLIPPQLPKAFYLTIWTDVPDPDPCEPDDYSHPNEIIWDNYCSCYSVKFVGWEFDPRYQTMGLPKFEFYQEIDPCDYWSQPNDVNVYWLGIAAVYGDMPEDPCYPWGWETREHFFQDDAVRFFGWPEPNRSYPASQFEPIEWQGETWDLSFELISRPRIPPKPPVPHLKWSQPPIDRYVNPYEMPVYWGWDEKSYNKDLQDPCGPWKIVADDFRCLGPMPITSIHWWGSHYGWEDTTQTPPASDLPTSWQIGFWSNVPASAGATYSYPKVLLHQFTVPAARVDVNQVGTDKFCDGSVYPYDVCYQYYVDLDPCEVFWQDDYNTVTQDSIFWLSIAAVYPDPCDPPEHPWGWKTRPWSWMDDAVTFNLQTEPVDGISLEPWQITPIEDPVNHESYDVAFELDTDPNYIKWEQPYDSIRHWPHYHDESSWASEDASGMLTYSRLVADDWKCERKTAVNAVVWWGSYIGYGFTPKHEGPWPPLPVKPDYFELRIWTDVPDPDPCDPANYSHPNEIVWEYKAYDYDEVFVGYDKHPHTAASPNEPVFRYSVRVPEEEWFRQPRVDGIYWLSVVAVYVAPKVPNYPWGWTNHKHVFNDDAVGGNWDGGTQQWYWYELCDQCGESEDMSFLLFTDPNQCNSCPDYNIDGTVDGFDLDVFTDNWLWTGPPGGFNDGDLNCDGEVTFYDYAIFALIWLDSCP
jgi:hypothetical protein